MGKPGMNTPNSDGTAEEGFGTPAGGIELLSPLTYNGREGGNPNSPASTGINASPDEGISGGPIEPKDPLGILDTIGEDVKSRGKRGGAYGK
jgi:hypothetical protein